jgi:sugar phosphate isomerase/epimerase
MACVSAGYMIAGRLEAAEAFARRGLELSRESKDRGSQAWLLGILGNLASRRSPLNAELVRTNYATALDLAQELGMRPLQAHCHFALGDVSAQVNDRSKAYSELLAAAELYRVMSMPFWLSQAESALAELS